MLFDRYGRKIDYLRISVTDRCNLRCRYCLPEEGIDLKPHEDILSFEEMSRIARACVVLGINKVRLTGGEPLVRKDLVQLIERLSLIEGLEDLSLTTNGLLLADYARQLKDAGLKRINLSLDSLDGERFRFISRGGKLKKILSGIDIAIESGFRPLKINTVVIKGFNDDEIARFVEFARRKSLIVRFIEFMPTENGLFWDKDKFVSINEIKKFCQDNFELEPISDVKGSGPAGYYRLSNTEAIIGFIAPLSEKFCANCNRLRLTADGQLKLCLHQDMSVDLKTPLREGKDVSKIIELIRQAVLLKPKEHNLENQPLHKERVSMCQIGG